MVSLSNDTVTLYDVTVGDIWERMSHRTALAELTSCRAAGDRVQEYETTDRSGRPLHIAVVHSNVLDSKHEDVCVYEFALPVPAGSPTPRIFRAAHGSPERWSAAEHEAYLDTCALAS